MRICSIEDCGKIHFVRGLCNTHAAREYRKKYPLRSLWMGMKQRCHNPNHVAFGYYGGRGIKVCEEWRESFDQFVKDVGERPTRKHSLDRIDNTGNYEPGNVRWVRMDRQIINSRMRKDNTSGIRGVSRTNLIPGKPWRAFASENGKMKHLGYFRTKSEAINARHEFISRSPLYVD